MARIGYIRVSISTQSTDRQDDAMTVLGVDRLFIDKLSRKYADRPELKKLLDYAQQGDTVVVSDISRLARSTRDLISIIDSLNQKKIGFISLKENIDTTSAQGQFILTLFEALGKLERENILARQKEGIESAKTRGRKLGRPAKEFPKNWEKVYNQWKLGTLNPTDAAKELKLKRPTFYLMIKRWEDRLPTAQK